MSDLASMLQGRVADWWRAGGDDMRRQAAQPQRQLWRNFGRQAIGTIPGVNAGLHAYDAYQNDQPGAAALYTGLGAAELAFPFVAGAGARAIQAGMPASRSSSAMMSTGALPAALAGLRPSQSTMRSAAPEPLSDTPLAGRTIEETTALLRQRARAMMDQSQRDYYTQAAAQATGHAPSPPAALAHRARLPGRATDDAQDLYAKMRALAESGDQEAARIVASMERVAQQGGAMPNPRQLERDGNLIFQNEPRGVGSGPSEGLTPEYLRAIREFWRMQRPDQLNSAAGVGAAGGLAAYLQSQPEGTR